MSIQVTEMIKIAFWKRNSSIKNLWSQIAIIHEQSEVPKRKSIQMPAHSILFWRMCGIMVIQAKKKNCWNHLRKKMYHLKIGPNLMQVSKNFFGGEFFW